MGNSLNTAKKKLARMLNSHKSQSKAGVASVVEEHARSIFDKVITTAPSVVIANVHMYEDSFERLNYYLSLHGMKIGMTDHMVDFTGSYVQPESRYRDIAVVRMYDRTKAAYLYKNAPVVLYNYKMYYIRGTVDITELMDAAASCRINKSETENRFSVTYSSVSGKGKTKRNVHSVGDVPQVAEEADTKDNVSTDMSVTPIKWRRDQLIPPIPTNPFDTVAVCDNFNLLRREAKVWKDNASWYKTRSVPWRYSAFVFGPPGSGKSTSIRALAQELGVPVTAIDLNSMDNETLRHYWGNARSSAPCMVLFEDIDRLFSKDKELDSDKTDVTLDALLNVMSGIEPSDGIICLMTANKLDNIDPALLRPGRTDVQIEVGYLNQDGVRKIVQRILDGYPAEIEAMVTTCCETPHTGAEVERLAQTRAVQLFWETARN